MRGVGLEPTDGFVTHGADTADLQPLHQTLFVKSMRAGTHSKLISTPEFFQTHCTGLSKKAQFLARPFKHHLIISILFSGPLSPQPEQVAAEDHAEQEDEEADAQDDDVDIEGEVVDLFRGHLAVWVNDLQSWATHASVTPKDWVHETGALGPVRWGVGEGGQANTKSPKKGMMRCG